MDKNFLIGSTEESTVKRKYYPDVPDAFAIAEKICKEIAEFGGVSDTHWQFFHDTYIRGKTKVSIRELSSCPSLVLDFDTIHDSIGYYLKKVANELYVNLCTNPPKDNKENILDLKAINEQYPDVVRLISYGIISYGICSRKEEPCILRTCQKRGFCSCKYTNNLEPKILSYDQIETLLKILNSENIMYIFSTYNSKDTEKMYHKKMALDRFYTIQIPTW